MNKQEAIGGLEDAISDFILSDFQRGKETDLTYASGLVGRLDDPEKPVVSQFAADWYEKYKNDFEYNLHRLYTSFHERKLHENSCGWFKFDKNKPIETPILIRKFGCEVEKERLHTAELPNSNSLERFVLRKNGANKIIASCYLSDNWKLYKNTRLIGSEIKKDFEWAWQFMKEVEKWN